MKKEVNKQEKIRFTNDEIRKLDTILRVVNGHFWNPENLTKQELREKYGN